MPGRSASVTGPAAVVHRPEATCTVFHLVHHLATQRLDSQGISAAVIDPRWIKPVNPAICRLVAGCRTVVTLEDGSLSGGFGSAVTNALQHAGLPVPVHAYGVPESFPPHGSGEEILEACHLAPQDIARDVVERFTRLDGPLDVGVWSPPRPDSARNRAQATAPTDRSAAR